jgi:pyruvate/2-oxoacid:ferredoxin oxidoreductase alpha subunit
MEQLDAYEKNSTELLPRLKNTLNTKQMIAEILIIAHGIVARSAMTAIDELEEEESKQVCSDL